MSIEIVTLCYIYKRRYPSISMFILQYNIASKSETRKIEIWLLEINDKDIYTN